MSFFDSIQKATDEAGLIEFKRKVPEKIGSFEQFRAEKLSERRYRAQYAADIRNTRYIIMLQAEPTEFSVVVYTGSLELAKLNLIRDMTPDSLQVRMNALLHVLNLFPDRETA